MNLQQVNGILRHMMTTAGGFGFAFTQDEMSKLLSSILAIIGILWSVWEKRKSKEIRLPMLMLLGFIMLSAPLLMTGCATSPDKQTVITPKRVEAVVSLAGYYGGRAAIEDGKEAAVESALAALQVMEASGTSDIPAIVAALEVAGLGELITSEEGALITTTVALVFEDYWANAQQILDSEYGVAVRNGLIRGLGLAVTRSRSLGDPSDTLRAEAIVTR